MCNELLGGYKGFSSILHSLKQLLPPFSSDDSNLPGLALFQSFWTCPTVFFSYCFHPLTSPSFHFSLVCSNSTSLSSVFLFLTSSKLFPSLTASNFSWLGERSNLTSLQLATNSLVCSDCTAALWPCPVAYPPPAVCHMHSLRVWE